MKHLFCRLIGHKWVFTGGRPCPKGYEDCLQPVYRCARCGEYDYGEPGGPGWNEQCGRYCFKQQKMEED